MQFRLLGPLEVLDNDRSLALGRGHQRALFALLLLNANEVVSTDRLIDELWGEAPPRTVLKSIHVYVSRLRKELGDGRLETQPPGYVLRVERSEIDLGLFEQLVAEAGQADPETSGEKLRRALDLWRGPALADIAYEPLAQAEVARLEELRWAATEQRIDADLACGRHEELIGELRGLIAEHPHRERLRAQLMLALYRSGRQADALTAYRSAQRELSEGLGLEPGEELRELEQAILRHDSALELTRHAATPIPPATAEPTREANNRAAVTRAPRRVSPRRLALAAGLLILAAAVAAAVVRLTEGGEPAEALAEVEADSVAVVDPRSNRVVGQVSIPGQPSLVAADARSVWVASDPSRTIARIDARTLAVRRIVPTNLIPGGLAAQEGAAWLLDGRTSELVKVEAAYDVAARRLLPGGGEPGPAPTGAGVDVTQGAVWVANGSARLFKVDPGSARISDRIDLPQPADGVAVDGDTLWAISAGAAGVMEIDSRSGRVRNTLQITSRPGSTRPIPIAITAGEGAVWVLNANTPSVTRIDPELGAVTDTTELGVGSNPTAIATGANSVWVARSGDGSLARIDAESGDLRSIPLGGAPTGVAVSRGRVWVSVQPQLRSDLASRGQTISVPGDVSAPFCSGVEFGGEGRPRFVIVSDLPLQHGTGPFPTLQLSDAIRFVLAERRFRAGQYDIGYQSCDDSNVGRGAPYAWTPATCRRNARAYADSPAVIGVIGTFESSCAALQIPILNRAPGGPLVEISGSTTLVGLTHAGPGTAPGEPDIYYPRGTRNFARVTAADDVQGAAVAVMAKRLGAKRLFVLQDTEPYGIAIAVQVLRSARRLGLEIAGTARWDYEDRDFTRLAQTVERSGADAVFLGGIFPIGEVGTPIRELRAALGRDALLLAPDGFSDFEALVETEGAAAEGMVVSLPVVPVTHLPGPGRDFAQEFEAAVGGETNPYSPPTAQAAEVLLRAIAASDGTRQSVTRNLFRVRVEDGILGDFEFDENGDTTAAGVTIYRIENGKPRVVDVVTPPRERFR